MKEFNNFTTSHFDNAIFGLMSIQAFDEAAAVLNEVSGTLPIERNDVIHVADQYIVIQIMGGTKAMLYKAEDLLNTFGSIELIKEILNFESKMKQIMGEQANMRTGFYTLSYGIKPLVEGDLQTLVEGYVKS